MSIAEKRTQPVLFIVDKQNRLSLFIGNKKEWAMITRQEQAE